jgi:uncharacterized membrane protein YbhN (UPF0104 family)
MKLLLRWFASAVLVGIALYLLDWATLASAAAKLTLGSFGIAVLIACAHFIPLVARWKVLAGGGANWYDCSARYLYANLLNAVSPANIAGDVYRFFAFRENQRDRTMLIAILIRERLLGLTSLLIGLVAATIWVELRNASPQWLLRALGVGAAAFLLMLLLVPRAVARLEVAEPWRSRIAAAVLIGRSCEDAVLLGWSLAALALWLATCQFLAARLAVEISLPELLAIVAAAELVRAVPITVQGVGLREGAFAALFGIVGYAREDGFVVGTAAYLALSVALAATGAFGALMLTRGTARA